MRLEKCASIAEIVSGVAIVATLVVLVLEVRENNKLIRVDSYQEITRDFDEWRTMVLSSPELLEAYAQAGLDGAFPEIGVDPVEDLRLALSLNYQFGGSERAYLAWRNGIVGDSEWERISRALCDEITSVQGTLRERLFFRLTNDFVSFLESECSV